MIKSEQVVVKEQGVVISDTFEDSTLQNDLVVSKDEALIPTPEMYLQLLGRLNETTARLEAIEKKLEESATKQPESQPEPDTREDQDSEMDQGEPEEENTGQLAEDEQDGEDGVQVEDEEEDKDEPSFSIEKMVKYVFGERWGDKWGTEEDTWSVPGPIWKARDGTFEENGGHYIAVSMVPSGTGIVRPPEDLPTFTTADVDFRRGRKPDRLAITHIPLVNEVAKICNVNVDETVNVFVRPFRDLLDHIENFKEAAGENEKRRDELQTEKKEVLERYERSVEEAKAEGREPQRPRLPKRLGHEKAAELRKATRLSYGMRCLLHFLENDLQDMMQVRQQFRQRELHEIEFEHLWHIFKPGAFVYAKEGKVKQAYRVLHIGGGRPHRIRTDDHGKVVITSKRSKHMTDFFLDCFNLDFDGIHYGPAPRTFVIPPYEGSRKIRNLEVIPFEALPETGEQDIRNKLVARGRKFGELAQVAHRRYNGLSLKQGNFRREEVDGDVIIDFALAFKSNMPGYEIEPPNLGGGVIEDATLEEIEETYEVTQNCGDFGHCEARCTVDDSQFDLRRRTAFLLDNSSNMNKVPKINDPERLLLLPYRVYGYVLLSRRWYPLDIESVKPLPEKNESSPDGFDDLVLPSEHKRVVRALVKTHARGPRSVTNDKEAPITASRDIDLVKGKGRGLIILLHGVPGVGKTSTAECVAANTNRPLFPITCGDIGGTTAREVEKNLESYFDLARKWGCVLLLDEADVFLGEREKGDIVQNSLVSVFLRVLEYYSGILILTTNRVGRFDEAIKSRIHISLYYAPLDKNDSLKIWKMNLKRLERERARRPEENQRSDIRPALPVEFNRKEILEFAKGHWRTCKANGIHWNGRQIKNAFQTAIALAEWDALEQGGKRSKVEAIRLETKHFKDVAETSARFDQYLVQLRQTDAERAKREEVRLDYFEDRGTKNDYGIQYPNRRDAQKQMRARRGGRSKPDSDEEDESSDMFDSDSESDSEEEVRKPKETGKDKKGREVVGNGKVNPRRPRRGTDARPNGNQHTPARSSFQHVPFMGSDDDSDDESD